MSRDTFGINMKEYCRNHEQYIREHLSGGDDPAELLSWHVQKLSWLQHERMVHLIVMVMSVLIEMAVVVLTVTQPDTWPWSAVFMLGWLILVIFYIIHYFFLENTVQHWYRIAEELHSAAKVREEKKA